MFKFFMSDDELYDELNSKEYDMLTNEERNMLDILSADDEDEDAPEVIAIPIFRAHTLLLRGVFDYV